MLSAIEIFCCYAREDQPLLQQLKNHLMPLQRQGLIQIWSDANINAGEEWEKAIEQHLETAEIVLLLISSDFMASEYCYSTEMRRAIQRHELQTARVIPIILRRTYWKGAPFEKLQFLPTDAKPITDQSWSKDEALYDVVEQIGAIVRELRIKNMIADARRLITENHAKEVLTLCEQALAIAPEHAQVLREKGNALFQLGRYEECLAALDQALQADPSITDVQFHHTRAQALERLQRYDEARAAYDLALQNDPQNIRLLEQKAALLQRLDLFSEALVIYKQLSSLDAKNAAYPEALGNIFLLLQEPQKALDAYDQAIQRNPNTTRLYAQRGEVLYALERYEEAVTAMDQAIQNHLDDPNPYVKKGRALFALKNYEEALDAYQTSIDKGSNDAYAHYGKGQALVALDKHEEAIDAYSQAIRLASPTPDPQFYHDLGRTHEHLAQQAYKEEQIARISWKPSATSNLFTNPALAHNLQAITLLRTLSDHTRAIWGVAFSPDGLLLASASADQTIKLWGNEAES
ncbi:MAG: hypothetical protein NVS2B12_07740 [Ktedonobacteraceae bacterium]